MMEQEQYKIVVDLETDKSSLEYDIKSAERIYAVMIGIGMMFWIIGMI